MCDAAKLFSLLQNAKLQKEGQQKNKNSSQTVETEGRPKRKLKVGLGRHIEGIMPAIPPDNYRLLLIACSSVSPFYVHTLKGSRHIHCRLYLDDGRHSVEPLLFRFPESSV